MRWIKEDHGLRPAQVKISGTISQQNKPGVVVQPEIPAIQEVGRSVEGWPSAADLAKAKDLIKNKHAKQARGVAQEIECFFSKHEPPVLPKAKK
jgi:hypothetical protein